MSDERIEIRAPWYRHPIAAMAAGIIFTAGLIYALWQILGDFGLGPLLLGIVIFPGPAIPGFLVGVLTGRRGALWAALASIIPILVIYAVEIHNGSSYDWPMIFIPIIIASIAAFFGYLGERTTKSGPKSVRKWTSVLAAILAVILIIPWIWTIQDLVKFRTHDLPKLKQTINNEIIRLPSGMKWSIRRQGNMFGPANEIKTTGHNTRLEVELAADGCDILHFNYSYTPDRPVKLANLESSAEYLKAAGINDKLIKRLEIAEPRPNQGFEVYSWFCGRQLLPGLKDAPCSKDPSCGRDVWLTVEQSGVIRMELVLED